MTDSDFYSSFPNSLGDNVDDLKHLVELYGKHVWAGMKSYKDTSRMTNADGYSENVIERALYVLGERIESAHSKGEL